MQNLEGITKEQFEGVAEFLAANPLPKIKATTTGTTETRTLFSAERLEGRGAKALKAAIKKADKIRGQEFFGELFEADAILAAGEAARQELEARENAQTSMLDAIEAANQPELF